MKKKILYVVFTLIIVASAIVLYIDYTNKPDEEEPEIYQPTLSEVEVKEEEKQEKVVEKTTIKMAPDLDLNAQRKKYNNNEIIGRLEIPDLFNVLVAKTNNNEFYLHHAVDKSSDVRGTEFLDYRVSPTSKQVNIYGHNTRDQNIKVAFLKLEKFLDKSFFDKNPYIIFQYDGGKSIYKIVAIKEVYDSNKEHLNVSYTGQQFLNHVKNMTTGNGVRNSRSDVEITEDSEIIVLQTCSHHWDNAYYTVIGVKIDY